jgi:hypothetical protein
MLIGYTYKGQFIPLEAIRGTVPLIGATVWYTGSGERAAKTSELIPVYQDTVSPAATMPSATPQTPTEAQTPPGSDYGGGGSADVALLPSDAYAYGPGGEGGQEGTLSEAEIDWPLMIGVATLFFAIMKR